MKRTAVTIAALVLFLGITVQADQLAFPGAEGYGCYATGGRGGDVYHVTDVNDYDDYQGGTETPIPGSLRYGIQTATGPRTIVFDVSGYIDLHERLEFSNDNITIAGQTAPGDGITLRKWDVRVYQAHNTIIRYLRVRLGSYPGENSYPIPYHNGGVDALSVEGSTDVIIDHCSLSWGVDEIASVTGDSNDVTYQWTYITEPLRIDQDHAYGSLLRPAITSRLTHHHNLYSDCQQRVSRLGNYNYQVSTRFDWANNVVYNWGKNETPTPNNLSNTYSGNRTGHWIYANREGESDHAGSDGEFVNLNLMRNYFIAGPNTTYLYGYKPGSTANHLVWAENNYWDGDKQADHDGGDAGWSIVDDTDGYTPKTERFSINSPLTIDTAPVAYDRVLDYGGNWVHRDAVDTRIISEVRERKGSLLYNQNEIGGFPTLAEVSRPVGFDTDGDGMPNNWETAKGFDPDNPDDRNGDQDDDGYTNLEEYLNSLVVWTNGIPGDYNADNDVDLEDLYTFLQEWLDVGLTSPPGDLYGDDNYVDFRDFAVFAENWTGP